MLLSRTLRKFISTESGTTLVESLVALALLGTTGVALLRGLATTSRAAIITDEQSVADSLAQSQMEWVKKASYINGATAYSPGPFPAGDNYTGYSVNITAAPLRVPDDGIQGITVTVTHDAKDVIRLKGYKVDR